MPAIIPCRSPHHASRAWYSLGTVRTAGACRAVEPMPGEDGGLQPKKVLDER